MILQYHFYADDTQLYITFKTDSADDACLAKSRVEHCVEEIDRWMISNKLKLNDDKTELIVFSSKFRPRPGLSNVQIGSQCIEHSNTVRNLGVSFDQTLSFGEHVYGVRGVSQKKFTMSDSFLVFYDFDILSMIKRKNPFRFYCVILILNLSRLIFPITILIFKVCRV